MIFKEPQWERTTKTRKCTFEKFLRGSFSEDEWVYFDYKYLNDNLLNCKEFKKVRILRLDLTKHILIKIS